MKKITKLWIGNLLFVILFYQQDIGLNVSIMAAVVWLLLNLNPIRNKEKKEFKYLSFCTFVSILAFAWYGDVFSFFALVFSLLAVGLQSQYPQINFIFYPILWFINYASFIFKFFLFKYWLPHKIAGNNFFKKALAMVMIPAFFVFIFILIYTSGSDIFYSFFENINFDLNFFQIIFLACLGFFLFFNLWFVYIPKFLIKINSQAGMNFIPSIQFRMKPTFAFLEIKLERRSGEISMILLNILLIFFIITYNYEQFFSSVNTTSLSNELHQRVAAIIFSIVMAIGVIMFYFKSTFNFDNKAGVLKNLSYLWIALNAILILSAFIKNTEYISNFGLTYKRIGVYIFLCLSLAGLLITFLKIYLKKTNAFLLNKMMRIFFFTFIISGWINYSWIVSRYNISFHKTEDIEYLKSLEFNKQILFNTYKNDPEWQTYFGNEKEFIRSEKSKKLLSSHLYFWRLNY